jgi:MerR family redox-sensitive transcriptional activator SoxR
MNDAKLTIGEVAQLVGLRTSAIRYYESVGVLPPPERKSGQRRYTTETVRQLQVIDVAKRAGFSLEEARALLESQREGAPAYAQLRALAQQKLPQVDALIERAEAMRGWLRTAAGCGCETLDACALFDADSDRQPALATRGGSPALRITHVGR